MSTLIKLITFTRQFSFNQLGPDIGIKFYEDDRKIAHHVRIFEQFRKLKVVLSIRNTYLTR